MTTSNTIPPAVVATVSATRAQSPVITTTAAHATDSALRYIWGFEDQPSCHPPFFSPLFFSFLHSTQQIFIECFFLFFNELCCVLDTEDKAVNK